MQWQVGIDEAGRGPLAGPVAVGAVLVSYDFDWSLLPGVGDSKQLSERKREEIFLMARRLKAAGQLDFAVAMVGPGVIDRQGITAAVRQGINRTLKRLGPDPTETFIKLDGLLQAPPEFKFQETIVKGDARELVIGLASIMAKVTRDRYMKRLAAQSEFSAYDFATHKGYGTKAHQAAIVQYGLSAHHRRSYCAKL